MKMMTSRTHETYQRVLRTLRARGDRPGFLEMAVAADIALARQDGDEDQVATLAAKLHLDLHDLGGP